MAFEPSNVRWREMGVREGVRLTWRAAAGLQIKSVFYSGDDDAAGQTNHSESDESGEE